MLQTKNGEKATRWIDQIRKYMENWGRLYRMQQKNRTWENRDSFNIRHVSLETI